MKKSLRSLLIGSAVLAVPQFASASLLLAGWYQFDGTTASIATPSVEAAESTAPGFSGHVTSTATSFTTGGSTDGYYGGQDPNGNQVAVATGNAANGMLRLSAAAGNYLDFQITNGTTQSYTLESLQFDAAKTTSGTSHGIVQYDTGSGLHNLNTSYGFDNDGNYQFIGADTYSAALNLGTTGTAQADFTDLGFLLTGFVLAPGQSIDFRLALESTGEPSQRIDNIAITGNLFSAVPEPGSMLALGCVIGSGAFLRTRRRAARIA